MINEISMCSSKTQTELNSQSMEVRPIKNKFITMKIHLYSYLLYGITILVMTASVRKLT